MVKDASQCGAKNLHQLEQQEAVRITRAPPIFLQQIGPCVKLCNRLDIAMHCEIYVQQIGPYTVPWCHDGVISLQ